MQQDLQYIFEQFISLSDLRHIVGTALFDAEADSCDNQMQDSVEMRGVSWPGKP